MDQSPIADKSRVQRDERIPFNRRVTSQVALDKIRIFFQRMDKAGDASATWQFPMFAESRNILPIHENELHGRFRTKCIFPRRRSCMIRRFQIPQPKRRLHDRVDIRKAPGFFLAGRKPNQVKSRDRAAAQLIQPRPARSAFALRDPVEVREVDILLFQHLRHPTNSII